MTVHAQQKVTASHLKRKAFLYVRQSSMQQVFENTESTVESHLVAPHCSRFVSRRCSAG